jgi:predicted S18 family serine protease
MKKYRVYFNRIEEYYIEIKANSKDEAELFWEESDLEDEIETGNIKEEIVGICTKDEIKNFLSVDDKKAN